MPIEIVQTESLVAASEMDLGEKLAHLPKYVLPYGAEICELWVLAADTLKYFVEGGVFFPCSMCQRMGERRCDTMRGCVRTLDAQQMREYSLQRRV